MAGQQVGAECELDFDVLAERPLHQRHHVAQQLVDIGRQRHQRLPSPEGEKPAGEIGAVLGGAPHRLRKLAQAVVLDLGREHVGIEQDRGQHVVEVVRHAAGQLADRFHALGLRQLSLGVLAVGNVGDDRADRRDRIGRVEQREFDAEHGPPTGRRLDRHLTLERSLGRDHLGVRQHDLACSLLRHDVAGGLADRGRDAGARPSLGSAVDERVGAGEVLDQDENRSVIHDGLELRLVDAQRSVCLVTLPCALAQTRLGSRQCRGDEAYFTDRRVNRRQLFAASQGSGLLGERLDRNSQPA